MTQFAALDLQVEPFGYSKFEAYSKSKGDRAFAVRAPRLWNNLPEKVRLLLNFLKPIFVDMLFCDVAFLIF